MGLPATISNEIMSVLLIDSCLAMMERKDQKINFTELRVLQTLILYSSPKTQKSPPGKRQAGISNLQLITAQRFKTSFLVITSPPAVTILAK